MSLELHKIRVHELLPAERALYSRQVSVRADAGSTYQRCRLCCFDWVSICLDGRSRASSVSLLLLAVDSVFLGDRHDEMSLLSGILVGF